MALGLKASGMELLIQALAEFYHQEHVHKLLQLKPVDGRLRARLFELGGVVSEAVTDAGGWDMEIELPRVTYERLLQQETSLERRQQTIPLRDDPNVDRRHNVN